MEFVVRRDGLEHEVRLVARSSDGAAVDDVAVALGAVPVDGAALRHGGVLHVDDAGRLQVEPGVDPAHPTIERRAFNRPPRTEYPIALPPITAPAAAPEQRATTRFGWAALVVPVVLGLIMAVVFHPRMAMFALFSPLMMMSNWLEEKRRLRKDRKVALEDLEGELAAFGRRLVAHVDAETRLRRRHIPVPELLLERAEQHDERLWERRPGHEDWMRLGIGTACLPWSPPLKPAGAAIAPEAEAVVRDHAALHEVPVSVDVGRGRIVGLAGDGARVLEVARSLVVQAAALHGPADLAVGIVTDDPKRWDWAKWLPHTLLDADLGDRTLAANASEAAQLVRPWLDEVADEPGGVSAAGPGRLLIVDVADLSATAYEPVRDALSRAAQVRLGAVALAATPSRLPSVCTAIAAVDATGAATLTVPDRGETTAAITAWRLPAAACRRGARSLAGLSDPDSRFASAGLPQHVRLLDLLGLDRATPDAISARWDRARPHRPAAPIAATETGPLVFDVVEDGPHGLLAGTTGSGKSELLRSLVASLAASASPEHLTFVLVDYKGGSAFDVCADLPHVVGMVTDLDGHLAQRALTCLEAELRYREHRLRDVGAGDLDDYLALGADEPLPRLLVVIDEFAALAKELPEFMASLVDMAQRGRSLGVHLLLATQRPNGVVNDHIRANTNLRVALRVQDAADSVDVVGSPAAASIARQQPGRGMVRRGPGDLVAFQTALVTGPAGERPAPSVAPFVFARRQPAADRPRRADGVDTDLSILVAAVQAAARQRDLAPARRPWPDPLPEVIDRADVSGGPASFAVVDEPARQRRDLLGWVPSDGHLLLYGVAGSGTSTALSAIALALADDVTPEELHCYVLDFDDQHLRPLEALPHVGSVVGAADRERQVRLLGMLQREIARRRHLVADDPAALGSLPAVVLMLDNYGGFSAAFDEPADLGVKAMLLRIVSDGPGVGIVSVMTAKQPVDVPTQVSALIPGKLLFRLADQYEYTGLGVPGVDVPTTPGRGYESLAGREFQVLRPHPDGLPAAVALLESEPTVGGPVAVGVLPAEVKIPDIVDRGRIFDLEWIVPVGLGDALLEPTGFTLGDGDHVLVCGPARSGKSTVLATMAAVVAHHQPDVTIVAVTPRRSPLADSPVVDHVVATAAELAAIDLAPETPRLVLVDDAPLVDDPDDVIGGLVDSRIPGVHVVAAGEAELLRTAYGHWSAKVKRSRLGIALRPNVASDGDLWQVSLPRRGPDTWPPGRGYLVAEGRTELVQVAWQ